ncbi:MAG: NUDIX domain-containing protein [Rikenellaceae bacterium]
MNNCYDIYFATNRLAISDSTISDISTTISVNDIKSANTLCRMMSTHGDLMIVTPTPTETFELVASKFQRVTAAGGIVTNDSGDDLMIYRNGRWDLPKGHWELGETIEECAMREVEEETGVGNLTIGDKICHTTHIYKMNGCWEIKQTHWYKMHSSHNNTLIPQREEGIERVAWCSKSQIEKYLPSSFPTIQHVFREVGKF